MATTSTGARQLAWPWKLVLALLPVVALVLLTEGALWAAGLGGDGRSALSRGFDPRARYLVPDADRPGGWRTQIFLEEDRRDDIVIPPKGERVRVLLFGGSNTQLLPQAALEADLEQRDPEARAGRRGWEVVNLGRAGYGSERVAILLDQALVLEPDVVVIYSGHNEFVERGFAWELGEAWSNDWMKGAAGALAHLRVFNVLTDAFVPSTPPEPVAHRDPGTRELAWEETLRYYEAYRANLEHMCRAALAAGARVVLCTQVSNLLTPPWVSTLPTTLSPEQAERFEALARQGLQRMPPRLRQDLRPRRRIWFRSWYQGQAGPDYVPPRLRTMLGALAETPLTSGDRIQAASVAGAHWPDPADWDEDVVAVVDSMERLFARELADGERQYLTEAGSLLEQALALVPDHPEATFDLAVATWLLGDDDEGAVQLFTRAAQLDRAPRSATGLSHAIVRDVAAAIPGVMLVDAERLFEERTPDGLPGFEVLMDHCHLHPGARFVLLDDIAQAILESP